MNNSQDLLDYRQVTLVSKPNENRNKERMSIPGDCPSSNIQWQAFLQGW